MYDFKGSKKLQFSTEDRPIFEDLEDSRPRPRTWPFEAKAKDFKTVLEDVVEAATSAVYMIKTKVAFVEGRLLSSHQSNLKVL